MRPGGVFIFLTPNARAVVTILNRMLRPVQHVLVPRLYGRAEADTFPVLYRANSKAQITQLAARAGLESIALHAIRDPSYLAFSPALYTLSVALSRVTPPVHLVALPPPCEFVDAAPDQAKPGHEQHRQQCARNRQADPHRAGQSDDDPLALLFCVLSVAPNSRES